MKEEKAHGRELVRVIINSSGRTQMVVFLCVFVCVCVHTRTHMYMYILGACVWKSEDSLWSHPLGSTHPFWRLGP